MCVWRLRGIDKKGTGAQGKAKKVLPTATFTLTSKPANKQTNGRPPTTAVNQAAPATLLAAPPPPVSDSDSDSVAHYGKYGCPPPVAAFLEWLWPKAAMATTPTHSPLLGQVPCSKLDSQPQFPFKLRGQQLVAFQAGTHTRAQC